jgi:hypothetical protein
MPPSENAEGGESPDNGDRIRDFWARHGGPAARRSNSGDIIAGVSGWSEVYAADGYTLRCEWSRMGSLQEMQFTEKPPQPSLP